MVESNETLIGKFREVRELIAGGWTQNIMEKNGSYCIMGAIFECRGKSFSYVDFDRIINPKIGNMVTWNDTKGRTQQEVLNLLDEIIEEMSNVHN